MEHLLDHEGVSQPDSPLGGTLAFSQGGTGIVRLSGNEGFGSFGIEFMDRRIDDK